MTPPAPAPGPVGPGPTTPGGPGTGGSNGGSKTGGIALTPDLSRWQFWWERNKDPFLLLKDAVHSGRALTGDDEIYLGASRRTAGFATLGPSAAQINTIILPALKRALDGTNNRDIVSACLMALALSLGGCENVLFY